MEDLEVAKAETALLLLNSVRLRLDALDNKNLDEVIKSSRRRAQANCEAYSVLVEARKNQDVAGETHLSSILQAEAFEKISLHELSAIAIDADRLASTVDDMRQLLPLQVIHAGIALEAAKLNVDRLQIHAPISGIIDRTVSRNTWVSAGAVLASMRTA